MEKTIKILIADDHAMVREGIKAFFASKEGFNIVGEAENGKRAVELAKILHPDVILMDMIMPVMNGLEAIQAIRQYDAHAKIIVITSFTEDDKVFPAIKCGAAGYLLKDSSPQQLMEAIIDVVNGKSALHPVVANKLMNEFCKPSSQPPSGDPLTEREISVLELIAAGLSNLEIAEQLHLSEWTVRTHTSNLLSKLHLTNRTQAALYALREGIATLDASNS
jgi:NarL family two-component system response regulator LiaR